jgi:two-component system response regulator DegU
MQFGLEPDVEVVGEARDGAEALSLAAALQPDVVVMDVQMPTLDGIAVTRSLRSVAPRSAVVMLSLHDNASTRAEAQAAGAAAFVGKHEPCEALLAAVRRAAGARNGSGLAGGVG